MIVFGLGNPGAEYSKTRHNVGFMTVDKLAAQEGMTLRKRCLRSYRYSKKKNLKLVEPLTFMNSSGDIFPSLVKREDAVIVVVDNMDLELGRIKVKQGGSDAGHNGLRSIIRNIGPDFIRIYIGIGRPERGVKVIDHVLSPFTDEEMIRLFPALDRAVEAITALKKGESLSSVIQRANTL